MEASDILRSLPFLLFCVFALVVFGIFLWGAVVFIKSKGEPVPMQTGKKILSNGLRALILLILVTGVFYFVSYFLEQGKVFYPTQASIEFPPVPYSWVNFPPAAK